MAQSHSLPTYPLPGEAHAVIAATTRERDSIFIKLLWHTGGRISEVLAIRAGDITPMGIRMLNLKHRIPTEKHVFCSKRFLQELEEFCRDKLPNEYVITNIRNNNRLSRMHGWRIVKQAAARAGVNKRRMTEEDLRPIWPHTFRHGYAINLLEQSIPITAVQAQLGHSNLSSTQVYAQLTDSHRMSMIEGAKF